MNDLTTQSYSLDLSSMPPALAALFDDRLYNRLTHLAETLSKAQGFTPPHLLGKVHACFAVATRAITWRLDPFAVAQATYEVGGKVAYEGKLVQAILEASGQLQGGVTYELTGDWAKIRGRFKKQTREKNGRKTEYAVPDWKDEDEDGLGVIVRAHVKGEIDPRELEFPLREAFPRNSVLWATRPSQQIKYTAVRAFASTVAPSLFMGVPFDTDASAGMRDVTSEVVELEPGAMPAPNSNSAPTDWDAEGRKAYAAGIRFRDCPGYLDAAQATAWEEGWQLASDAEHGEVESDELPAAETSADGPEVGARPPAESDETGDGGEEVSRGKERSPADQPAPRSLDEMVAACGKNVQQKSRVKHAFKASEKGSQAFEDWYGEQFPPDKKLLEPFVGELREHAEAVT